MLDIYHKNILQCLILTYNWFLERQAVGSPLQSLMDRCKQNIMMNNMTETPCKTEKILPSMHKFGQSCHLISSTNSETIAHNAEIILGMGCTNERR